MNRSSGNVGIGTTSPYGKLHINGGHLNLGGTGDPAGDQGNNWLTWGYRADNNPYYAIRTQYKTYGSYTYSRLQLNWHTGIELGAHPLYGGVRFFDNSPGVGANQIAAIGDAGYTYFNQNVGIGTTGPGQKLSVVGQISVTDNLRFGGDAVGQYIAGPGSDLTFYSNYLQRMVIKNGGNVGIGMTGPSNKLHVDGAICATQCIGAGCEVNCESS